MTSQSVTYANSLGELLGPFLLFLRSLGFFEPIVFMPIMTLVGLFLFVRLRRSVQINGTFEHPLRKRFARLFYAAYFTICFIGMNSIAVALKTFIVEETDYETAVWYLWLVAPLHIYIVSVALAFLVLIWRNRRTVIDQALCVYTLVGMLGGFYIAIYRLVYEPFVFTDPTSGISGVFLGLWFSLLSLDIFLRLIPLSRLCQRAR